MKQKRIQILLLIACLFMVACQCGCDGQTKSGTSADDVQRKATTQAMNEAQRQVGMPAIINWQERKLAKMIFELRDDEKLVCYAYLVNRMTGEVGQFLGKCLGFGLPYSVQFTNPMRIEDTERTGSANGKFDDNSEIQVLPQPDPNGLFMPEGLSATWLMLIDPETGEPRPVYVEPEIIVSPFPLHE